MVEKYINFIGNFINSVIFPAPPPTYDANSFSEELFWIPSSQRSSYCKNTKTTPEISRCLTTSASRYTPDIPCLLLRSPITHTRNLLLYIHGNAEDLGVSRSFCETLCTILHCHVLLYEYPGYGIFEGITSEFSIINTTESVLNFITNDLSWPLENLIIFGRSIGSGPAIYLANILEEKNLGGLLLMAPYLSIKDLAKEYAGVLGSWIVSQRFDNITKIKNITCPILFIHGKDDEIIPYQHSLELHANARNTKRKGILIPSRMTHNEFNPESDLYIPVIHFFQPWITSNPTKLPSIYSLRKFASFTQDSKEKSKLTRKQRKKITRE